MAYFPTIALGLPFFKGSLIDAQASAFYDRVIADGGVVPTGLVGVSATFTAVKAIYGVSDITAALSVFYDPHYLAYKKGTGTGATAGRAIEKLYSACGASGDAVQTTLASQPLLLEHSGTNYVWLSGVTGNYFRTPNVSANELINDFDIKAFINCDNGILRTIASKYFISGSRGFRFDSNNNNLRLWLSSDGTSETIYTSTATFTPNIDIWVRVTRNATNGNIIFYTSADGINWTQLGIKVIGITGSIFNPNTTYEIGSRSTGNSIFVGNIYRVTASKTIDGTSTVDFNPQNYVAATSQSAWTSTTGEVWTRNRDVLTTGLKAAIVDRTMMMTNGTSHSMQAASLNINAAAFTNYTAFSKFNNSVTGIISELGVDADSASGYYHAANGAPSTETTSINGNVGGNSSVWTQASLLLKLGIQIGDTTLPNPETNYYINNVAATLASVGGVNNNTANMNGTALNLFARNNGASLWFNGAFRTMMIAPNSQNTAQRLAIYNYIKTLNNSAF